MVSKHNSCTCIVCALIVLGARWALSNLSEITLVTKGPKYAFIYEARYQVFRGANQMHRERHRTVVSKDWEKGEMATESH